MATKKHSVTRAKLRSAWGCNQRKYSITNGELGYLLVRRSDHWVFWRKSTYPSDQSQYHHIFKWTNHISKQMHKAVAKRGEIDWTSHRFWFNLWLVERVAQDFLANHSTFHKCFDRWLYLHPLVSVLQPWPLLFVEDEDSFHRHRSLHCKEYRRTRWNGRSYEVEQQPKIPKTAEIESNWLSCHPRVKTNGSTPMPWIKSSNNNNSLQRSCSVTLQSNSKAPERFFPVTLSDMLYKPWWHSF